MKHLRLTHLRVVFHHSVLSPGAGPPPVELNAASDSEGSDFLQHVVQDADLYPAAIRLLDTMETLQYVLLTTCGARQYGAGTGTPGKYWYSSRAWRVASVDEHLPGPGSQDTQAGTKRCSGSCVEIDDEAAEMVIEQEELYMGRREEVSDLCLCFCAEIEVDVVIIEDGMVLHRERVAVRVGIDDAATDHRQGGFLSPSPRGRRRQPPAPEDSLSVILLFIPDFCSLILLVLRLRLTSNLRPSHNIRRVSHISHLQVTANEVALSHFSSGHNACAVHRLSTVDPDTAALDYGLGATRGTR